MSSYRSAYENYYKNINNDKRNKKDKSSHWIFGKKTDNVTRSIQGINMKDNAIIETLIKRVIKELTGATILLLFFVGLKYIPSVQVQEMHINCKQVLIYNFNYDECIDVFNTVQIGNVKGKDLRIGNFSAEDLKIENLKAKASNFMEYLKNNNNIRN